MNSQLFIDKLASKINMQEADVSIYLETFVLGFATELQTYRKASFDPFGVFEVEKRLEYIEKREDGSKILNPPSLKVVFSSSAILGVLKLDENEEVNPVYELFEERYEWQKEATSLFIAQIKSVIKSQFLKDKKSVIPGFGTFEGELGGDIIFTPDEAFAETINKPFSHFQAVELSCNEKELKSTAAPETVDSSKPKEVQEASTQDNIEAEPRKEDDHSSAESVSVELNAPITQPEKKEEVGNEKPQETHDTTPLAKESPIVQESKVEEKNPIANREDSIAQKEELPVKVSEAIEENIEQHTEELEDQLLQYDDRLAKIEQRLINKDQVITYYKRLTLLLGLILIGILVFWYWSAVLNKKNPEVLTYENPEVVHSQEVEEIPAFFVDTLAAETPTLGDSLAIAENDTTLSIVKEETTSKDSIQSNYKTTEVVLHKLKAGETLRGLSLRYYQTKDKWNKIVEANPETIDDPDFVPVGTVLKIPK